MKSEYKKRKKICLALCLFVIVFMTMSDIQANAEEKTTDDYTVAIDCIKGGSNTYNCTVEKISDVGSCTQDPRTHEYKISPILGSKYRFIITVKKESGNIIYTESKNLNYEYRYEQIIFYVDINEATEHNIRLNFCIRGKNQEERLRDAGLEKINGLKTGDVIPDGVSYPISTESTNGVLDLIHAAENEAYPPSENQYLTENGEAYTYLAYVNAPSSTEKKPNLWRDSVAPVLAEFKGTIKIVTGFALAVAVLTGILTLIINVVKLSAVPSHPIKRRQYIMDILFNIICIALLGGINLLSRLAILIVIPSA